MRQGPGRRVMSGIFFSPEQACIVAAVVAVGLLASGEAGPQSAPTKPPPTLHETGLYADGATLQVDPGHLAFEPQYPLWTDGAAKRRWISIPPGSAIDASDPNAWVFPAGTRLWKEFSFGARRVETRFMELHADGQWRYAAYAWSPDGRESLRAREAEAHMPFRRWTSHTIPSVSDCKACHQGGRTEVLGFSALQLSPDRDPAALHAEQPSDPIVDLIVARQASRASHAALESRRASLPHPPKSAPLSATCMPTAVTVIMSGDR